MTESPVRLTTALSTRGHTKALKDGQITPSGVHLDLVEVVPIIAAFRRMIRDLEFDVCELAPTTYLAAREAGIPLTAIPVFLTRRFHHGDIVCRPGSGIKEAKDLEGRRVGVRAYTVSTGVWLRGILESEYDVDLSSITWVVDDEEHVTTLQLPANVEKAPAGDSIADQFASGQIDAALTGPAGIGRKGAPQAGWGVSGAGFEDARQVTETFYPLFEDAGALEADWYHRTSIYPIHGLIAIKAHVIEAHPGVAESLIAAFDEAKARFLKELEAGSEITADHKQYRQFQSIVGSDPLPFGVHDNRPTLDALCDFSVRQGILKTRPTLDELFVA